MYNYNPIFFLSFLLLNLNSIFSTIIINFKTRTTRSSYSFDFQKYINLSAIVKVNNKTVNSTIKNQDSYGYKLEFPIESGEVEIILDSNNNLTSLSNMFYNSLNGRDIIEYIKIKTTDTNITNLSGMFSCCFKLVSADLSEFDISKVTNFKSMFYYCKSLVSVKFGNYQVSNVKYISEMFENCHKLVSLDLSTFNTSSVGEMNSTFYDCKFLTSINISNFRGDNISSTYRMFYGCNSLTSLDLRNFKPKKIKDMNYMFYDCLRLKSLDLNGFDTSLTTDMSYMFSGCKSLFYLNINSFTSTKVTKINNMFEDCASLSSLNLSNFIIKENTDYNYIFYGISDNIIYCMNEEFYDKIKSDMSNKKCAIWVDDCNPDWIIKSKKIINDNGECVEKCSLTESYKYEFENRCYSSCPIGTTSLYNNDFLCETFIDNKYKEYIEDKQNKITKTTQVVQKTAYITDIKSDINTIEENMNNNRIGHIYFEQIKSKIYTNTIIDIILHDISSGSINNIIDDIIQNKIDMIETDNNIKYQITSSFNQKNNFYDDISVIDLQSCETKLKEIYSIPPNEPLIIFKYDYNSEQTLIPIVGYEVFNPITKEKLNLNHCNNIKIDIFLPVNKNISEDELYKHDPNNNFYKDRCSSFSNEKGVDMTIYDRKTEYNEKNYALCSENCDFINYNNETKKALCQCEPQFNSTLITFDKIINKKKLLNNFLDIKKSINLGVIKCYKKFISKSGLIKNIGNYIILFTIIIYLITLILLLVKDYKIMKENIEQISLITKDKNKSKNIILIENTPNPPKSKNSKNLILNTDIKSKNQKMKKRKYNLTIANNATLNSKFNLKKNIDDKLKLNKIEKSDKKSEIDISTKYNDTELNILNFSLAKKNDKRTYIQLYVSNIKTRHPLISAFLPNNDYNPIAIKISLLFFIFALSLFVNSLFFTDGTMHKIVEDEGIFNFVYNLPITIYSTIISLVIGIVIKKLALSEDLFLEIKNKKKSEDTQKLVEKTKKTLLIKLVLFFIICFVLLLLFWFYLGCFCAVYTNTQIYLIKDTLISFALSLIIPFIKYSFSSLIRKISLNKPGKCLYKISQLL